MKPPPKSKSVEAGNAIFAFPASLLIQQLGGADISWIVGSTVTFFLYFFLIRNRSVAPEATNYPEIEELEMSRRRRCRVGRLVAR